MRSYILFLALAAISLGSCTTSYRTGQTPDDVYYSPVRPQDEYVVTQQQDDRYYGGSPDYYTDRYLRMRLNNRYQWSALDDYYFNNPYVYNYYGSYNSWYSPWNSYWAWNSYCNPYYVSPIFIKNPIRYRDVPSRAVVFNPKSYLNTSPQTNASNLKGSNNGGGGSYYNPSYNNGGGNTRYNNSNSNSRGYSNSSNSNNNNNSRSNTPSNTTPTRSYTPSSSSSSSSSGRSSSSSSTPTRPPR